MHDREQIIELENDWASNPRWLGVVRKYPASEVVRLRGSIQLHYTLAEMGATRLWHLLHAEPLIRALGALTGNQAVEMVSAGLQAIYLSGWQVAGDANDALADVSRSIVVSRQQCAECDQAAQQCSTACRSDSAHAGQE